MTHIHEKIDFTATVFVVHENRVLLRLHEKYNDWFGVGGHIELDEDANTAAIREVKEEVGLDITLLPPPHWKAPTVSGKSRELIPPLFLNIHYVNEVHQHHDFIYVAISDTDAVIPEHPDDQWLWLTEEDLTAHTAISDRIKHYARVALETTRNADSQGNNR